MSKNSKLPDRIIPIKAKPYRSEIVEAFEPQKPLQEAPHVLPATKPKQQALPVANFPYLNGSYVRVSTVTTVPISEDDFWCMPARQAHFSHVYIERGVERHSGTMNLEQVGEKLVVLFCRLCGERILLEQSSDSVLDDFMQTFHNLYGRIQSD